MNTSIFTTTRPKTIQERIDHYIKAVKKNRSYFVTFGSCMRAGWVPLQKRFVTLEADSINEAHHMAHRHFGSAYAFIYPIDELDEQISQFGLKPIDITTIHNHGGVTLS